MSNFELQIYIYRQGKGENTLLSIFFNFKIKFYNKLSTWILTYQVR